MFPVTRLRRLRKTPALRRLIGETEVNRRQLIRPVFVVPGKGIQRPIASMPGQFHFSADVLAARIREQKEPIGGWLLFGVPEEKKIGSPIVTEAIQQIKEFSPDTLLITDVCLCAYTDHGHCGVLNAKGEIENDASLELLSDMALRHVKAGADMVAPSDMMDGRIAAIRKTLDGNGFSETPIMSYAAKYASAFYGPFREAAHSTPSHGDRKSYQMNPANRREALREMAADLEEGADILMVKPAGAYLDIIAAARERFDVPIAAYQVSGEYAMIQAAAEKGWIDRDAAIQESLLAIKRAGADIIISYFCY